MPLVSAGRATADRYGHAALTGGGAVGFDILSAGVAALLFEMVLDRGMDGDRFLQTSHALTS